MDKVFSEREKYYKDHYVLGFFRDLYIFYGYKIYNFCEEYWYKIKWGFQRMFRGYDDRMLWDYPHYNAQLTIKVLKKLQKNKTGYPIVDDSDILPNNDIHPDAQRKWDVTLGKIIAGFKAFVDEDEVFVRNSEGKYDSKASKKERERLRAKWKEGSELFIKFYGNLWD